LPGPNFGVPVVLEKKKMNAPFGEGVVASVM